MADRWFQLRETGSGTTDDPYRPEYVDEMGLEYTGTKKRLTERRGLSVHTGLKAS